MLDPGGGGAPTKRKKKVKVKRATRTPTEIGQTTPKTKKGQKAKAKALAAPQPPAKVYPDKIAKREKRKVKKARANTAESVAKVLREGTREVQYTPSPKSLSDTIAEEAEKTLAQGLSRVAVKTGLADKEATRELRQGVRKVTMGSKNPSAEQVAVAALPVGAFKGAKVVRGVLRGSKVLNTAKKGAKAQKAIDKARKARKAERAEARAQAGSNVGKVRATGKGMSAQARNRLRKTEVKAAAKRTRARAADRAVRAGTSPVVAAAAAAPGDVGEQVRENLEATFVPGKAANPIKTAVTTAKALPGLFTVAGSLGGAAIKSAKTGDTGYLEGTAKGIGKGLGEVLAPLVEGDSEEIARAMEEDIGYPLAPLVPRGTIARPVKAAGRGAKRVAAAPVRKVSKARDARLRKQGKPIPDEPGKLRSVRQRLEGGRTRGEVARDFNRPVQRATREAGTMARRVSGQRRGRVRPDDAIPAAAAVARSYGIGRQNTLAEIDKALKRPLKETIEPINRKGNEPQRPAIAGDDRALLRFIKNNPEVLDDPAFWRAWDEMGKQADITTSEVARHRPAGDEAGVPPPEVRTPVRARRITEEPTREGAWQDVRTRQREAGKSRRKGKTVVRPAEKKLESARRRRLRAEVSEAEAKGASRVRVSAHDRKILRTQDDYVAAVKELNAGTKALNKARANYGNASRLPARTFDATVKEHIARLKKRLEAGGDGIHSVGMAIELRELRRGTHPAKAARARVEHIERYVKDAREGVNTIRASIYKRAEAEASKIAAGEPGDARLASLNRAPVGQLRTLLRKGGNARHYRSAEEAAKKGVGRARRERRALYNEAALLDESARDLLNELRPFARSHSARPTKPLWDKALREQYVEDVTAAHPDRGDYAWLSERSPSKDVPQQSARGQGGAPATTNYIRSGRSRRHGQIDRTLAGTVTNSIVLPRVARGMARGVRRVVNKNKLRIEGASAWTGEQIAAMHQRGVIDLREVIAVPARDWYQAMKKADFDPEDFYAGASQSLVSSTDALRASKKGSQYVLLPREVARELDYHLNPSKGGPAIKAIRGIAGISSRVVLFSPAWAAAQVVNEGTQLVADVGVRGVAGGVYDLLRLRAKDPDTYRYLIDESASGRPVADVVGVKATMTAKDYARSTRSFGIARKTPFGRMIVESPNTFANFDRWKTAKIRAIAKLAHTNRSFGTFTKGLGGTIRVGEQISARLAKMKRAERHTALLKDPELRRLSEKYLDHVDDMLGNWESFTRFERDFGPFVAFYPYLRMSLRWTFRTFPQKHPIKAQILYLLSQQNREQLENLIGHDPGVLESAFPVLYDQEGEPEGVLPGGGRFGAPASNVLVESIGDKNIAGVQRLLNPALSTALTAWSGVSPFTGEQDAEIGTTEWGARALASLLNTAPPLRVGDFGTKAGKAIAEEVSGRDLGGDSPAKQAMDDLDPDRIMRSVLNPFDGMSAEDFADKQILARALEDASDKPEYADLMLALNAGDSEQVLALAKRVDLANDAKKILEERLSPYESPDTEENLERAGTILREGTKGLNESPSTSTTEQSTIHPGWGGSTGGGGGGTTTTTVHPGWTK